MGERSLTRSFSTDQLLDTLNETILCLRDPVQHRGTLRPHLVDAADAEFTTLWNLCEWVGLDMRGIPAWRSGGRVRGLSTRTTSTHVGWMIADLCDRLPVDDTLVHQRLWSTRLRSISASADVASLMAEVRDNDLEDEFTAFRAEDSWIAS